MSQNTIPVKEKGNIANAVDKRVPKDGYWSIGVKNVASNASSVSDFTVQVSPDDDLEQLHSEIETKTGLTAAQQRLIYRGRLINGGVGPSAPSSPTSTPDKKTGSNSMDGVSSRTKIKDIAGLTDGHTIHLVERKIQSENTPVVDDSTAAPVSQLTTPTISMGTSDSVESNGNSNAEASSTGAASLLAALLGMGGNEVSSSSWIREGANEDDDDDETDTTNTTASVASRPRWRPRYASTRRRHLSYRLTEDDLHVPDPGSMESVRQGLLTLHTLLSPMTDGNPAIPAQYSHSQQSPRMQPHLKSPLDAQRRFFRGQWIDVRDTVNQWLEATVVEVVLPEEILPSPIPNHQSRKNGPTTVPATDPAISAGDMEGRRRLLLETCDEVDGEPNLGIELDSNGNPMFFRQRDTNNGVQLLLVHYNGWPHRWDEWIRSDSERIRPFRTRTRHPNNSQRISPTVQSPFAESPSTNFLQGVRSHDNRERDDRQALLPELSRVLTTVHGLVSDAANNHLAPSITSSRSDINTNLPWVSVASALENDDTIPEGEDEDEDDECKLPARDDIDVTNDDEQNAKTKASLATSRRRRQDLEMLAPLLDRLGRTLVDAAPHVAALAASLEEPEAADNPRGRGSAVEEERSSTLGTFLSLLSRDRNRTSVGSSNAAILGNDSVSYANSHEQTTVASSSNREDDDGDEETIYDIQVDPDYTDFATGLVNTTRGEARGGGSRGTSRQSAAGSNSDELAGLLGAYLAAASLGGLVSSGDEDEGDNTGASTTAQGLGRILRERGAGGNGIDIHIHAVVTAPGGNVGLATVGGGGLGGATLFSRSSRDRAATVSTTSVHQEPALLQENDDDDLGIFAELYSETPDPIDPASPTVTSPAETSRWSGLQPPETYHSVRAEPAETPRGEADEDQNNRGSVNLPSPALFSRSSRRSGFVSSSSHESTNSLNSTSASNVTEGSAGTSSRLASNGSGGGRQSRGGVMSRFFRRSHDSNNSN